MLVEGVFDRRTPQVSILKANDGRHLEVKFTCAWKLESDPREGKKKKKKRGGRGRATG